jgi:hypothetical protein
VYLNLDLWLRSVCKIYKNFLINEIANFCLVLKNLHAYDKVLFLVRGKCAMDVIAFTTVFTLVLVSPTEPGAGTG